MHLWRKSLKWDQVRYLPEIPGNLNFEKVLVIQNTVRELTVAAKQGNWNGYKEKLGKRLGELVKIHVVERWEGWGRRTQANGGVLFMKKWTGNWNISALSSEALKRPSTKRQRSGIWRTMKCKREFEQLTMAPLVACNLRAAPRKHSFQGVSCVPLKCLNGRCNSHPSSA